MTEVAAEIATLKEQVKSSHKRIDTLEESVKMVPKIETLLEVTIETNKKQSETLNNININLTKLNHNYDSLTHRIGIIEDDNMNSKRDSSININKLGTEMIFKIVPSVIGGIILALLLIKFGLK